MDNLKIFKSETVLLKGKKGKETICICLPDYNSKLSDNKIRMGKCVRNNLKVKLGDIISIEKYPLIPLGNKVHILPFEDTIQGISGNLTKKYLIPFFKDAYRPVYKGDTFICKGENGFKEVEFKVIDTDPEKCCIVGPHTVILDEGEPLKRDKETEEEIEYDDINKKGDNKENSIAIIFRSIDQNITYAAVCKESDNFAKVGQEVLKEYPQLKDKNIFYIHEGSIIDRNKTLKENKVKHNSNILINIQ